VKKFIVTVEGQAYEVLVEEIGDHHNPPQITPLKAGSMLPKRPLPEPPQGSQPGPALQPKPAAAAGRVDKSVVAAPMPGSIVSVLVKAGDTVRAGDVLLILEAMKMENEVTAPLPGNVAEVFAKQGATVNSGDPLIVIA